MKKMVIILVAVVVLIIGGVGLYTLKSEAKERNEFDYVSDIAENARVAFNKEVGCDYLTEVEHVSYSLYKVETRPEYKRVADVTMYFDSEKAVIFRDGSLYETMYYSDIVDMLGQ